jgi:translation initiation factor 2B subunit (eIF-2B alpha/beta/delta family)
MSTMLKVKAPRRQPKLAELTAELGVINNLLRWLTTELERISDASGETSAQRRRELLARQQTLIARLDEVCSEAIALRKQG